MHLQQSISKYSVFFLSDNISSKQVTPEQEYLISCNLPVLSFVLVLTCKDKDKESNMSKPPLKLPVKNRLPGTFPDYLPYCSQVAIFNCCWSWVSSHQEVMNHPNARVAFHSCIRGQILQENMPHMHGGKPGKILLKQGEQVRQVKMIH
ncbi:hypothetical protein ACFX2A_026101 [Malus domestica]